LRRFFSVVYVRSLHSLHCSVMTGRTSFLFEAICYTMLSYAMILVTTPAPTVRPPSRMANFEPCSSATGTISSTVRFTSSPGITISTPSGSVMSPVTSIVRM